MSDQENLANQMRRELVVRDIVAKYLFVKQMRLVLSDDRFYELYHISPNIVLMQYRYLRENGKDEDLVKQIEEDFQSGKLSLSDEAERWAKKTQHSKVASASGKLGAQKKKENDARRERKE